MPVAALLVAVLAGGCGTLPRDFEAEPTRALPAATGPGLPAMVAARTAEHPGLTGVHLLDNGLDAFVARSVLAEQAVASIDIQYYLYHGDLTGLLLTRQLVEAADRGVRVRLLVDDMSLPGRDRGAAALDAHPLIEVRIFNPFHRGLPRSLQLLTRFGSVTRRMHNKTFTVDGLVSIVGGRNIGDEYFDAAAEANFSDIDALVMGPVVAEVSAAFDDFWNSSLSYPVAALVEAAPDDAIGKVRLRLDEAQRDVAAAGYLDAARDSTLARSIRNREVNLDWAPARVVRDAPEKVLNRRDAVGFHLAPQLAPLFRGVERELVIVSPYFIPGRLGVELLAGLTARGVRVRVLTNSLASTDVAIVHSGYARYRRRLLEAGVELYETMPDAAYDSADRVGWGSSAGLSLHTKSFVFDGESLFVGSLNLDPRSVRENTEIGLIFDSSAAAGTLLAWFREHVERRAYRVTLEPGFAGGDAIAWRAPSDRADPPQVWRQEPGVSAGRRLLIGILRLLPIESQL